MCILRGDITKFVKSRIERFILVQKMKFMRIRGIQKFMEMHVMKKDMDFKKLLHTMNTLH